MTLWYNQIKLEDYTVKRNIEPDYKFDMEKFAEVFKAAIGDRSYTQFAKDAGISFGYTSKYVNMKHDVSPTVQTIKKIAAVSNGPSYLELLEAAGYNSSKYEGYEVSSQVAMVSPAWSTMNALLPTFCRTNFKWQFVNSDANGKAGGPIAAKVEGAPFDMWFFIPVTKDSVTKEDISAVLGSKKAEVIKLGSKVTFLTESKSVFEEISAMELRLISLHISVAFINPKDVIICDERYLETAVEITSIDNEFMFTNIKSEYIEPLFL